MFIQFYEQLNQGELDILDKVATTETANAVRTVFNTLRNQLKSLELEVKGIDTSPPKHENWEDESRKHLARFFGNLNPST